MIFFRFVFSLILSMRLCTRILGPIIRPPSLRGTRRFIHPVVTSIIVEVLELIRIIILPRNIGAVRIQTGAADI